MEFRLGQIVGLLLALAAGVCLISLIGAVSLQWATVHSLKFRPTFIEAYKTSLLGSGMAAVICLAIGFVVGFLGKDFNILGYVLLGAVGFFANAIAISAMLQIPGKGYVSVERACWLTTVQLVASLVIIGGVVQLIRFIAA